MMMTPFSGIYSSFSFLYNNNNNNKRLFYCGLLVSRARFKKIKIKINKIVCLHEFYAELSNTLLRSSHVVNLIHEWGPIMISSSVMWVREVSPSRERKPMTNRKRDIYKQLTF